MHEARPVCKAHLERKDRPVHEAEVKPQPCIRTEECETTKQFYVKYPIIEAAYQTTWGLISTISVTFQSHMSGQIDLT